jgi:predicted hotdog family 3-hydroxylacyl-ACP dehydratase
MAGGQTQPSIEDLLPHRGRMLLIDEIVRLEAEAAVSRSRVAQTWPLYDGAGVSAIMVIELVAQTCGLSNGYQRRLVQGEDSNKKGFLVGIKTSRFYVKTLPLGADIFTEARNRFKFEGFREIEGVARIGDEIVGRVTLQVVQAAGE